MKAQKTAVAKAIPTVATESVVTFNSLKDASYKFALIGETAKSVAEYVVGECPNFLQEVPKEVEAQLIAGWMLRKQELMNDDHKIRTFNTEWIPDPKGGNRVTLDYVYSFSQQEVGRMRIADPVKHGIVTEVRNEFSKYKNEKMKALKTAIRNLNPSNRKRAENKDFNSFISDTMTAILDKAKSVNARNSDKTCDPVKTRMAVDAFNKVYNKKD
jgi:hypothetical protein